MSRITKTLSSLGFDRALSEKLNIFGDLFEKWNRSINLSAARSQEDIQEHMVDSLHLLPYLSGASRVLDVGAGGGFPAVVAAICLPDVSFVALEPVHKKHAFLRTAARELGLGNLEAFAVRLDDHPERDYDAASSRATFDLRDWLMLGGERVRPGGLVLGFEAIQRDDLPEGTERHPYALGSKTRAIVALRRPAAAD